MASVIWYRTTQITREETRCRHIGYSFRLAASVILYASSHRQDKPHHGFYYTSCGALVGIRNCSLGLPWRIDLTTHHERTLWPQSYISLLSNSPLSYFSFQPVLHNWCNKGCGVCCSVRGMVHIKEPLLLIGKSSPCGGSGFPFSLSEWSFTICPTPYNRK